MPIPAKGTRAHSARPIPDLEKLPDGALLTRGQLAVISTFALPTLKLWARQGRGPRVTVVEGRPRYRAGDVRAWLAGAAQ
jgi:hypothetical protein